MDATSSDTRYWMFEWKVTPCQQQRPHDWQSCPCAHNGETARRRPPYLYSAQQCPDVKAKRPCPRGESCPFTHSLFEFWLHPDKFRTCMCEYGSACNRRICFFAHDPSELRQPPSTTPDAVGSLCSDAGSLPLAHHAFHAADDTAGYLRRDQSIDNPTFKLQAAPEPPSAFSAAFSQALDALMNQQPGPLSDVRSSDSCSSMFSRASNGSNLSSPLASLSPSLSPSFSPNLRSNLGAGLTTNLDLLPSSPPAPSLTAAATAPAAPAFGSLRLFSHGSGTWQPAHMVSPPSSTASPPSLPQLLLLRQLQQQQEQREQELQALQQQLELQQLLSALAAPMNAAAAAPLAPAASLPLGLPLSSNTQRSPLARAAPLVSQLSVDALATRFEGMGPPKQGLLLQHPYMQQLLA